ncbi:unnamed protein product [Spirodela intermedia]|uniref:Uncharacterized protein n=1 Tax=Spirodela intermedia TaxID=51605 RepID=A0A7I8IKX0_SPIIN|nr:unnamed protein product [Spirodela intermedia]CAA6658033.1 unnamed protein product [Spirodela intermedia]
MDQIFLFLHPITNDSYNFIRYFLIV